MQRGMPSFGNLTDIASNVPIELAPIGLPMLFLLPPSPPSSPTKPPLDSKASLECDPGGAALQKMYERGYALSLRQKTHQRGQELLLAAAEQGHVAACVRAGFTETARGSRERLWNYAAATHGNTEALLLLGHLLSRPPTSMKNVPFVPPTLADTVAQTRGTSCTLATVIPSVVSRVFAAARLASICCCSATRACRSPRTICPGKVRLCLAFITHVRNNRPSDRLAPFHQIMQFVNENSLC